MATEPQPYTLAELEDAPVDDIWGTNSTRIVVTKESVAATINDNARLRALIKAAEWQGQQGRDADEACPWCGAREITSGMVPNGTHAADCPAFSPEGEVK